MSDIIIVESKKLNFIDVSQGKILVMMSTYNGEMYLEQQVESILNQKYKYVDLLIRDDHSCDDTKQLLKKYENLSNISIIYGKQNVGFVESFFSLIDNASMSYDYYAFSDQDDYWDENKISAAINMLEANDTDAPMLYACATTLCDRRLNIIGLNRTIEPNVLGAAIECFAPGHVMVFNRKLLEMLKQSKQRQKIVSHDWWAYLIAVNFGRVILDKSSYVMYRQHGANSVGVHNHVVKKFLHRLKLLRNKRKAIPSQLEAFCNSFEINNDAYFHLYNHSIGDKYWVLKKHIIHRNNFIDKIMYTIFYLTW